MIVVPKYLRFTGKTEGENFHLAVKPDGSFDIYTSEHVRVEKPTVFGCMSAHIAFRIEDTVAKYGGMASELESGHLVRTKEATEEIVGMLKACTGGRIDWKPFT